MVFYGSNMVGTRVGIDISDEMVVAVAVKGGSRKHVVAGVASVALADGEDLTEAIRAVVEQLATHSAVCVSVIPSGHLSFRNLQMPFQSVRKIEQTISYELETMLPTAVGEQVVDFVVATPTAQPDVLAAAVEREYLAEYLTRWRAAGVEPTVLEVRNVPLAGWLAQKTFAPDCGLLLDIWGSSGEMVLFRQGRVVLVREISIDGDMRSEEMAVESCRRFCRSVLNTVRSCVVGEGFTEVPEVVFVTGPLSGAPRVLELLSENLGLRVERVDLAAHGSIGIAEAVADKWDGSLMDTALALALRGRSDGFNFRKEEFALHRPWHRFKKEIAWGAAFAVVLLALFATNLGIEYMYLQRQYRDLDRQVQAIFHEALPEATRIVDPVLQLRVRIKEINSSALGPASAWAGMSVLDFLKELSVRIPASSAVRMTRLSVDQEGARVKGVTDNFNNVDGIKKNLEASPLFKAVAISSANLDRDGNKVRFELRIQ